DALHGPLTDMTKVAASWRAGTVIDEWSAHLGGTVADDYVDALHDVADELHLGLAFWSWRGYRGFGATPGDADGHGGVGVIEDWDYAKGAFYLNGPGVGALARPYALAVPGRVSHQHFDRTTTDFVIEFDARGGEAAPLVYIPAVRFRAGYDVLLDGEVVPV